MEIIKDILFSKKGYSNVVLILVLMITLFTGLMTISLRSPMVGLDEMGHYARSIELSNGNLLSLQDGNPALAGGKISNTQYEFIEEAKQVQSGNSTKYKATDKDWYHKFSSLPYTNQKRFYVNTNTVPYTPFSYLPYVFTAYLSKMIGIKPVTEYLLMRLVGFLTYFLLFILAIKITPVGKFTLAFISTIPTVIVSWTNISADGYMVAISALFFAVILRVVYSLRQGKSITLNDVIGVSIVTILLSMGKIPIFLYLFLLLPLALLLRKKSKFEHKAYYYLLFLFGFSFLVTVWWVLIVKNINTGAYFGRNVDTFKQLSFILSDIPSFLVLLARTLFGYNFFVYTIGYTNDLAVHAIPKLFTYLSATALLLSIFTKYNSQDYLRAPSNIYYKVFDITKYLISVAFIISVFIILYLQFSEIGSHTIDGVQERYFIPIYFILLSIIPKRKISSKLYLSIISLLAILPAISYWLIFFNQL